MNKLMLLIALAFGLSFAQAQSDSPELGIRFGGGNVSSYSSIDGILPLSDVNRLHGDLSFGANYLGIEGLYEWQFPIGEGFLVYPGLGGAFYTWNGGDYWNPARNKWESNNYSTVAIVGVIGIEYQIEPIPLSVGIDFRTGFGFSNSFGLGLGGALMCRYRF